MNQKQLNEQKRLIEAGKVIVFGRWFYVSAIGLTGIFTKIVGGPNANFPVPLIILMDFIAYGLNLVYYFYFKYARKTWPGIKTILFLSFMADTVIMTCVIYFAGGIISIGFLYYIYGLIASAFIYSFWGVALIATINSIAYGSLIFLEYSKVIPYISRYNIQFESQLAFNIVPVITNTFAVVTSFFIIGYFSGLLAKNLRKKENEIIAERDKEKAILSNLSDGLIYINSSGVIDMINSRAKKMLGLKEEDIIGKNIKQLDLKKLFLLDKVLKSKNLSQELNTSEDKDTYLRVYSVEVKNEDNKLIGTAKIVHDISREKYVDKIKSEFITIAGHQLRTPLSAIKGALSLFLSGDYGKINREQETIIKQSYDYTERLIKIVNDMLNVSSAEEGKFNYEFAETNVKDFVENNSERFVEEAKNKKINLIFNFADKLPSVELDVRKFRLVFNALLENALVYNKENGSVEVSFNEQDGKLLIIIRDTGIGIPQEDQEKVFTKFFRADNALKFFTEGNGLDLFVVKNIIDNHQGDIWFESGANKGTTFFIKIPFVQTKKGVMGK